LASALPPPGLGEKSILLGVTGVPRLQALEMASTVAAVATVLAAHPPTVMASKRDKSAGAGGAWRGSTTSEGTKKRGSHLVKSSAPGARLASILLESRGDAKSVTTKVAKMPIIPARADGKAMPRSANCFASPTSMAMSATAEAAVGRRGGMGLERAKRPMSTSRERSTSPREKRRVGAL